MIFQAFVRRQRYLLTIAAIALSILYSLPVFAGSFPSLWHSEWHLPRPTIVADATPVRSRQAVSLFRQLNLTSEQQQEIKRIHLRYQKQVHSKKQNIAKLQQQLSDMMVGTEPTELLRAKNQQLNTLRQQMGMLRFESMLATREILTPQQRLKFRELVKDFPLAE